MDNYSGNKEYNIYRDIRNRTNGEIYLGIVGPVRTGKSTFIKRFMELMVLPFMEGEAEKERAMDELPQAAAGKTIMTTEPKFIPQQAAEIRLSDFKTEEEPLKLRVRLIDCVGFLADGAVGHMEGNGSRMVKTPWSDQEIPFAEAASIGTEKVIRDHATIGIVVTTDGTIGELARENYINAEERTVQMLNVYADFCEEVLAMPVIRGRKTEKEKFAGAEATYTIEALMHDGKALQSGTSHNFGDGFAKAFGIQFTDKDNKLKYVYQTSWGMTTRLIGAIIMVHGDDSGLVLPPRIAPVQTMVIPIQQHKEGVLEKAQEVKEGLVQAGIAAGLDDSDKSPGWKFSEQEMRGIPVRVELGPKDIEAGKCVLVRRDTREKTECAIEDVAQTVKELLETIQREMFERAKAHRDSHISDAHDYAEFKRAVENKPGFIRGMWCGDQACEDKIKEETTATSRCMPFEDQEHIADTCVCCGKPAHKLVYWGKAY